MAGGELEGRGALITGAGGSIGAAAARLFAEAGTGLVLLDKHERVQGVAEEVRAAGGRAVAIAGDSADEAVVQGAVARVVELYGRIDACFANAGISGGMKGLFEQTVEEWTEVFRVNLLGTFLAVRHSAERMKAAGRGSIVCTASVAGLRNGAAAAPYSAAKAGVISLAQLAANDLAGTGVRVNAVCPGLIETNMTQPIFDRARERGTSDRIGQLNPLRRPGQPEEIAAVALFLASDAASYINGQAIAVDGGLSSSLPVVPPRPPPRAA
jgi:NAD(P)-dependent dehydrogenase (short-subunit alcohol dehydrogenase family)